MYGATHVIAVDGYSRKIVRCITLPVKNPIAIYEMLFRPIILEYGMWQQVRVDHGTEFFLMLEIQRYLSSQITNPRSHGPAVLQTTSTNNHRVERLWPEINSRVNYPIKELLIDLESSGHITMRDDTCKYCV